MNDTQHGVESQNVVLDKPVESIYGLGHMIWQVQGTQTGA